GEISHKLHIACTQLLGQQIGDFGAQLRGVSIPGDIDQRRDETSEDIFTQEQANLLALLNIQNRQRRVVEFLGLDLEDLVTGVGRQDLLQFPRTVIGQSGAFQDGSYLMTNEWNLTGALLGRRGVVKPKEAMGSNHFAGLVEPLDQHQVDMDRTMDRGTLKRLGKDQRVGPEQTLTHLGWCLGKIQTQCANTVILTKTQLRAFHQLPKQLLAFFDQLKLLITQALEMTLLEPLQKLSGFRLC